MLKAGKEAVNVAEGFYSSNGNQSFTFSKINDTIGPFENAILNKPQRNVPENITHALAEHGVALYVH